MTRFNTTPNRPHRALTEVEIRKLLAAAPPDRRRWYRVALATGFRLSELRAVKVRNLDPFAPALTLEAADTKNRKPARQYISRELMQELQELALERDNPDAPLLEMPGSCTTGEHLAKDFIAADINRVTREGKATFHSFRVNFINNIVESGCDLKTIMTLARHGSASMSMETYAKAKPDRLRQAANAAALRVEEAQKPVSCCAGVARQVVGGELECCNTIGDNGLAVVEAGYPARTRTWNRSTKSSCVANYTTG